MGSNRKKPDKLARSVIRNPVAGNPLLGKGGEHKTARGDNKQSRAKSRRALRSMRKQLRQDDGGWQSSLNSALTLLLQTVLPATAVCRRRAVGAE